MAEKPDKPLSPFTLTPARITLLALGALAILYILGALMGGVGNYQALREAASEASASASSSAAPSSAASASSS